MPVKISLPNNHGIDQYIIHILTKSEQAEKKNDKK